MERIINNAENFLPPTLWRRELLQESSHQLIIPKLEEPDGQKKKRIQFNSVGVLFCYDSREAPIKIPHFTSERVQKIDIKMSPKEESIEEIDDAIILEEKLEEMRRKKQEEKYVKVTVPIDEEEDEEEKTFSEIMDTSVASADTSSTSSYDSTGSISRKKKNKQ